MRGKWVVFFAALFTLLFVAGVSCMLVFGDKNGGALASEAGSAADSGQTLNNGIDGSGLGTGNTAKVAGNEGVLADGNAASFAETGDGSGVSGVGNTGSDVTTDDGSGSNADTVTANVGGTDTAGNNAINGDVNSGGNIASGAIPDNGNATNNEVAGQDSGAVPTLEESDRINMELARRLRASYDRVVVLDPGHGGTDNGLAAVSSDDPQTELREKDLSLDVARKVKEILEQKQICVLLTRDGDLDVGSQARTVIANGMPADLFVSLHTASDTDTTKHGMSATYNANFYAPQIQNAQLAYDILKHMEDATKEQSLGMFDAKKDADIMLLMIPSVEISLGQMSNAQDVRLLMRDDYRGKLASGIADGILAAFERMEESRDE